MKRILLSLCALIAFLPLTLAQMAPDVDTLGNVWIVTIDESESMLTPTGISWQEKSHTSASLAGNVRSRMLKLDLFENIDFEHDRFIFYKSGYSYREATGLGVELGTEKDLNESLIRDVDYCLHKFRNKTGLVNKIYDIMSSIKYDDQLSFVSQIRTFAVVKAVNMLKENEESVNFKSIRILTITDNADQSDQWRDDSRILSLGDGWTPPGQEPISSRTKKTIQKYVYNELTGQGAGIFVPLSDDDSKIPHIWAYEYVTVKSMSDTLRSNVLRISARDGKHMTFVPKHMFFGEDSLCFYGVDSVVVNGEVHVIGKNFNKRYEASFPYRNGIRFNDVKVYGSVQFKYEDDIYGPHYKKQRFVQEQKLPSGIWAFIFTVLGILAGVTVLGYLAYRLIILPRRTIATLYSGNGSKIQIRRGFRFQWKNEVTPVALYETGLDGIASVLVRKHRNIMRSTQETVCDGSGLLICSRVRLNVSDVDLEHSTFDDIDVTYLFRQRNYPELLKAVYRKTLISKARKTLLRSTSSPKKWILCRIVALLQKVTPMYYYYFNDVSRYDSVCLESPQLLVDRKFIIESSVCAPLRTIDQLQSVVNKALSIYYFDVNETYHDALLCYDVMDGKEYWNIVLLDDPTALSRGLKSVSVIYRFMCDADPANKAKNEKALYNYARRKLRRYSLGILDCTDLTPSQSAAFNISFVPVRGFISFVEYNVKPKAQMIYSPFEDRFVQFKYVSLRPSFDEGHLYMSFLPYKYNPDGPMISMLSSELVRPRDMSTGKLYLKYDELSYRGINVKLNN